ncbi:uncharacterized protein LOC141908603 [Tubulanus polymorphus]|uniref:uncharacterized protein LOC141908603 n=1 Tax=Tubulanus polymorphus TaxID=672921 RepID=UPI003DA48016
MDELIACLMNALLIEEAVYNYILTNSPDKLRIVLENKYLSVNQPLNKYGGHTALHIAIIKGRTKCVKTLLDFNSDPVAEDDCGKTPLELAFTYCRAECLELLLGQHHMRPDSLWEMADLIQNRRSPPCVKTSLPILGCIIKGTPVMSRSQWQDLKNHLLLFDNADAMDILKLAIVCGHRSRDFFKTHISDLPAEFQAWFAKFRSTPQLLMQLCNSAIRRSLTGTTVYRATAFLPIPDRMKSYLIRPEIFLE